MRKLAPLMRYTRAILCHGHTTYAAKHRRQLDDVDERNTAVTISSLSLFIQHRYTRMTTTRLYDDGKWQNAEYQEHRRRSGGSNAYTS